MILSDQVVHGCTFEGGLTKGRTQMTVNLTTDLVGFITFRKEFDGKGFPEVALFTPELKDDGTMQFTAPVDFDKWEPNQQHIFKKYVERGEKAYQTLVSTGMEPGQASHVVPSAITHKIIIAGSFVQWTNFFLLCKCPFVTKFLKPVEKILLENHEDYFGKVFKK